MKRLAKFITISSIFLAFQLVTAQDQIAYQRAQKYLQKQNEVYFSFALTTKTDLNSLTDIISLSHQVGSVMYAYANSVEFENFIKLDIDYNVERSPGEDYTPQSTFQGSLDDFTGQSILNYDKYVEYMEKLEKDYPQICKRYEIGKSVKGKLMLCIRITKDIDKNQNPKRPRFYHSNAVHGDELNGTKLCYALIDYLVKGYERGDARANKYLEGVDLWIAPHINPDGTFPRGNTTQGCKRTNSAGVDLNRDYPIPNLTREEYTEAVARAQPETQQCMDFEKKYKFNFSCDNHDAMRTMICHWSHKKDIPVDMPWMEAVGGRFCDPVNWDLKQAAYVYIARGTRMDWQPFYNNCWGFTPEYENKGPNPQCTWPRYEKPFLGLLDDAMCGISGTVTEDGQELNQVKIELYKNGSLWDKDGTEAYSRENGYYIHYAPEGTYDVKFTSGSKTKTYPDITVTDGKPTKLDAELGATSIGTQPIANSPIFTLQQHTKGVTFTFTNISQNVQLAIYSVNGTQISSHPMQAATGNTLVWDSAQTYKGCYIARIKVQGKTYSQKFVLVK